MKQNAVLLFRSSFGQLVQDNVEGPSEHFVHRIAGNGRMRSEDIVQKREREIDKNVQEWRLNSLRGVEGVASPCRKRVPPLVHDSEPEAQAHQQPMSTRDGFDAFRMAVQGIQIFQRSVVIPSEQAFAMLGGYRPDRHGPWINPAWISANPLADEP